MKDHKMLYLVVFLLAAVVLYDRMPVKDLLQLQVAAAAPLEMGVQPAAPAAPGPGPGYLSISPFAFRPPTDGYDFLITGAGIEPYNGTSGTFYAAVYLPNGARVNRLTCYWTDTYNGANGICALLRLPMDSENVQLMAAVDTFDSATVWSFSDVSIDNAVVDNSSYTYYAKWWLPYAESGKVVGRSVLIEYGYDTYLPLTIR